MTYFILDKKIDSSGLVLLHNNRFLQSVVQLVFFALGMAICNKSKGSGSFCKKKLNLATLSWFTTSPIEFSVLPENLFLFVQHLFFFSVLIFTLFYFF